MGSCWSRQGGAPDTAVVYSFMRAKGLCDVSGACTIGQLHQAAQLLGFTLPEVRTYGEQWADWRSFFLRHAGQHDILMETADGQALRDAISGQGKSFCLLDNGAVLNWNQQTGVHDDHAADVVGELWDKVQSVQQALAQCQSQPHGNPAADQALALAQSLKDLLGKV